MKAGDVKAQLGNAVELRQALLQLGLVGRRKLLRVGAGGCVSYRGAGAGGCRQGAR